METCRKTNANRYRTCSEHALIKLTVKKPLNEAETRAQPEFIVNKPLLCYFSKFFDNALNGEFLESGKDSFTLEEGSHRSVEQFVGWLYTGKITSSCEWYSHDEYVKDLDPGIDLDGNIRQCQMGSGHGVCQHDLIELYLFAEYYNVRELRTEIITVLQEDALLNRSFPGCNGGIKRTLIDPVASMRAFNNLREGDKLYKLVRISLAVGWQVKVAGDGERGWSNGIMEHMPKDALCYVALYWGCVGQAALKLDAPLRLYNLKYDVVHEPRLPFGYDLGSNLKFNAHEYHDHHHPEERISCEARPGFAKIITELKQVGFLRTENNEQEADEDVDGTAAAWGIQTVDI